VVLRPNCLLARIFQGEEESNRATSRVPCFRAILTRSHALLRHFANPLPETDEDHQAQFARAPSLRPRITLAKSNAYEESALVTKIPLL
jgi:hypothetical protein